MLFGHSPQEIFCVMSKNPIKLSLSHWQLSHTPQGRIESRTFGSCATWHVISSAMLRHKAISAAPSRNILYDVENPIRLTSSHWQLSHTPQSRFEPHLLAVVQSIVQWKCDALTITLFGTSARNIVCDVENPIRLKPQVTGNFPTCLNPDLNQELLALVQNIVQWKCDALTATLFGHFLEKYCLWCLATLYRNIICTSS